MELEKITRTTLTMKETAEYLVKRKQIPCSRVGGKVLFRKEALDSYLKQKEEASTTNE